MRVIKTKTRDGIVSYTPYRERLMQLIEERNKGISPQSKPFYEWEILNLSDEEAAEKGVISQEERKTRESKRIAELEAKIAALEKAQLAATPEPQTKEKPTKIKP